MTAAPTTAVVLSAAVLAGCSSGAGGAAGGGPSSSAVDPSAADPSAVDPSAVDPSAFVAPTGEGAAPPTATSLAEEFASRRATSTPSVSAVRPSGAAARSVVVVIGELTARDAGERSVARAYVAYQDALAPMRHTGRIDRHALDRVAGGEANLGAEREITRHGAGPTVGTYTVAVTAVARTGPEATVDVCDVDATGAPDGAGAPAPVVPTRISRRVRLVMMDGTWKVAGVVRELPSCG